VAEQCNGGVTIERVENLSIVSLKIARKSLAGVADKLRLAAPVSATDSDPRSIWLGPDHWLLVSNSKTPDVIIGGCKHALTAIPHNAVDYSAGLAALRIVGPSAAQLLATGTGIDLRSGSFPVDSCCRTRLAQIAAVIVAEAPETYTLYVDRSYETYLTDWLAESASIHTSYQC